jgi:hypothetical protein
MGCVDCGAGESWIPQTVLCHVMTHWSSLSLEVMNRLTGDHARDTLRMRMLHLQIGRLFDHPLRDLDVIALSLRLFIFWWSSTIIYIGSSGIRLRPCMTADSNIHVEVSLYRYSMSIDTYRILSVPSYPS